jgi:DNA-binding response OmpR family regulator
MNDFEVNVLLLVEDSDDDVIITQRKVFKSSLKIGKFLLAKSLTEALCIIKTEQIDVILLDLNLPETRGLDTLNAIRAEYNGVIVVCTSIDDELTGIQAIRQGADDYVIKSSMTETSLARAVLHARIRRESKNLLASMREKTDKLTGIANIGA